MILNVVSPTNSLCDIPQHPNKNMAQSFEIKMFHVSERLPSLRVPALVVTKSGAKYIAARFETNPLANDPNKNQIKWGLLYNGKIIGEITDVLCWCPLSFKLVTNNSYVPSASADQSPALIG